METLDRIHKGLLFGGLSVASVMILFMALFVSLDVLTRIIGWGGLPWVVEISEYFLFLSTFLAAPHVLKIGGHVRVDILLNVLPPRARRYVQVLSNLMGLTVCGFLVLYGFRVTLEALQLNTLIFKHLVIPEWWLLAFIPFTTALLFLEFLLILLDPKRRDAAEGQGTAGQIQDGI